MERTSAAEELLAAARLDYVRTQVPSAFGWREAWLKTFLGSVTVLAVSALTVLPFAFYLLGGAPPWSVVVAYAVVVMVIVFASQAGRAYQAERARRDQVMGLYAQRQRTQDWPLELQDRASSPPGH